VIASYQEDRHCEKQPQVAGEKLRAPLEDPSRSGKKPRPLKDLAISEGRSIARNKNKDIRGIAETEGARSVLGEPVARRMGDEDQEQGNAAEEIQPQITRPRVRDRGACKHDQLRQGASWVWTTTTDCKICHLSMCVKFSGKDMPFVSASFVPKEAGGKMALAKRWKLKQFPKCFQSEGQASGSY